MCNTHQNIGISLGWTLFVIASVYALIMEFFGMEFTDTFYYACHYDGLSHIDVFHSLNQILYVFNVGVFGKHLIAARLMNWLAYYLAGLIVLIAMVKTHKGGKSFILCCASLAVVCIPVMETTANNGNGLSCLFLIAALVTLYLYYFKDSQGYLWGTAVCMTCAALSRFPNIIILPLLFVVSIFVCRGAKEWGKICLCCLISLGLYILVNVLVFGSLTRFLDAIYTSISVATDTEATGHTTNALMTTYLKDLKDMVSYGKILSLIAIVPFIGYWMRKKTMINVLAALFALLLVAFLYFRIGLPCAETGWRMTMMLNTILLICTFIQCAVGLVRHNWSIVGWGIMPMAFSVCAAAGADAGLMFITPAWIACLPLIAIQLHQNLKQITTQEVALLIYALLGLCFCAVLYVRHDTMILGIIALVLLLGTLWFAYLLPEKWLYKLPFDNTIGQCAIKRCMGVGFVLLFCMILISKVTHSSDDQPLPHLTAKFSQPQLYGIHSNPTTVDWVNAVMAEYDKVKGQPVIFYGYLSAVFPYLTGEGWIDGMDFTYRENARNLKVFYKAMEQRPIVFLCPINPGARAFYTLDDYPIICTYLLEHGYRCEQHGCYNIYIPE